MNWTFAYIAVLYFAGVWAVRRGGAPLPWRVAALFYAFALIFFFPTIVLDYTTVPADFILGMYPWRAIYGAVKVGNPEMNDAILQMVPWAHQVRESWRGLEAPLWNAAAGGGYPLLANGQSQALALTRLLALPLELADAFACEAALKVLAALTFTYLYFIRWGRSQLAAIIAASSFGFCTFLTIWLHYPHSSVAAFLPATFYAVDLLLDRVSFPRFFFSAAVMAMLLLHGHPETAAHTVFASGLYVLFRLGISEHRRQTLTAIGAIAGSGLVSILLALPFLLPFIEALPRSQRYEMVQSIPIRIPQLPLMFLTTFVQPSFLGLERARVLAGVAESLCGYAGILGAAGFFGVLFYLIRSRRWREPVMFYVVTTPLLISVVLGWRGFSDLIHMLPLYSMAANSRLRVIICWCLAILAGEIVDLILRRNERRPLLIGVISVFAALGLAFALKNFPDPDALTFATWTTLERLPVLVAALLLLFLPQKKFLAPLLLAAVLADLWAIGWRWYPPVRTTNIYPVTTLIHELQMRSRNPGPGEVIPHRIAGTSSVLFPNSAAMYGLQDIRAHDPMAFGRVLGALRVFTGYTSDQYFGFLKNIDDPFLDYLNVRYVVTTPFEDYASERFALVYSGPDGRIYQNRDALPRFFAARNVFSEFDDARRTKMILEHRDWGNSVVLKRLPSELLQRVGQVRKDLFDPRPPNAPIATVKILSATTREFHLDINAPRWTLIIGSQPNWPGWRIYRGKERLKQIEVNDAFMGFLVPPGKSDIRIRYVPRSFYVGTYISLTTLALLAAGLIWSTKRGSRVTAA